MKKGFTLIELMIVMAIMAILAAVVIPEIKGHQEAKIKSQEVVDPQKQNGELRK